MRNFIPSKSGQVEDYRTKYYGAESLEFKFRGEMIDRQALMYYWNTEKGSQDGGALTMLLDVSGRKLDGWFSGTVINKSGHSELAAHQYWWFKGAAERGMNVDDLRDAVHEKLRSNPEILRGC